MKNKYFNDAIIGNKTITASFSMKGELLRLFYPSTDFRQFIDFFHTGVKINDSALIYLHDDINNNYKQSYIENTNILETIVENTYFNLEITQTDFVMMDEDVLVKKYKFKNKNTIDLDINFLVHSKLLSSFNNMVGSKISKDVLFQYSHNYTCAIFTSKELLSYQLNNSKEVIKSGVIHDKDHIGMSPDSSTCYKVGILKPNEEMELNLYIFINDNKVENRITSIEKHIERIKNKNIEEEFEEVKKYWVKYLKTHKNLELQSFNKDLINKCEKIYNRTILLYPLLTNEITGGISAALEVDEEVDKCGRYSYCWTRDAVFITKALDLLNMTKETEKFYEVFCKNTQSSNGMWEQRFFTDGNLAPAWGYQIDETASVVFGVFEHYKISYNLEFLKNTLCMCEKAIGYLEMYLRNIFVQNDSHSYDFKILDGDEKIQVSYDLWENFEGVHLYSLAAIYAAFESMKKIYLELRPLYVAEKTKQEKIDRNIIELDMYIENLKKYIQNNLYDPIKNILRRNNKDTYNDISILGTVVPFGLFDKNDKQVVNTVEQINMTIRTYTGGYLRYEKDNYMGGKNPWPIATLWMALYNIEIGNEEEAKKCLEFVINTANEHGFLAEQIDNESMKPNWVIGLGWSHAMFILVLNRLSYLK